MYTFNKNRESKLIINYKKLNEKYEKKKQTYTCLLQHY